MKLSSAGLLALVCLAGANAVVPLIGPALAAGDKVTPIFRGDLPTVPGKDLTVVTVDYAPGGSSPAHRHAASAEVFAYVVRGAVRSRVNDGEEHVYESGEFWYEPPGSTHSVSANASATEPARILAFVIADEGAKTTTYDE